MSIYCLQSIDSIGIPLQNINKYSSLIDLLYRNTII